MKHKPGLAVRRAPRWVVLDRRFPAVPPRSVFMAVMGSPSSTDSETCFGDIVVTDCSGARLYSTCSFWGNAAARPRFERTVQIRAADSRVSKVISL